MKPTFVALTIVAMVALGGCSQGASDVAGARVPADDGEVAVPLYAPTDRTALAFGLPEIVQGMRLEPSTDAAVASAEAAFARDLVIKPILVARGLGPSAVSMAQRSDRLDDFPHVATSAVWVSGLSADVFAELDPSFYLLLTTITPEQYRWGGEKPSRVRATVLGRELWSSDWGRFQVVWYTWGEVLYVILAENQQLLEATLRQMPWPPDTA